MDFTIITRLRLKEAFNGNAKFQAVIVNNDYLNELYEHSTRGTSYVFDDLEIGHSVFIQNTRGVGRDKVFIIKNRNHNDMFLWHIDGVLYTKNSKCDCAILTEKELIFVEFKSNAENQTDEAIIANFEKAKEQLLLTIDDIRTKCKTVDVDLSEILSIKAYAVFNRTIPNGNAYKKNISADFFLKSDGIKLLFDNKKTLAN